MGKPTIDMTGQRYGRLTVIERDGSKHGNAAWLCVCDCGTRKTIAGNEMRNGGTVSCGCFHDEGKKPIHGFAGKGRGKLYNTWKGMRQRCNNPRNPSYVNYGGRGIYVCDRWNKSFLAFLEDMGEPPNPESTIERVNNDGPYAPENCIWASREVQSKNQRQTGRAGENNPKAKLTDNDVRAIRLSSLRAASLAEAYDVTPANISDIRKRKTWKHIE